MINLAIFGGLLFLGYYFGTQKEKTHFQNLRQREQIMVGLPHRSTGKKEAHEAFQDTQLFYGSVVLGQDYFEMVVFGFVNLFGGRITVYETLLDRGRREALLRVKEQAKSWGAEELVNLRYETASITQSAGKNNGGVLEIMAYGTGIKR